MKAIFWLLILGLVAPVVRAQQTNLTELLQQGMFEEQANRNLDAAIADYQALSTQFDKDRQLAATAVFRLGECYREEGLTNQAAVEYRRIISEFPDQKTLAMLSRQDLAGMGAASSVAGEITGNPAAQAGNSSADIWNKVKSLRKAELEKVLPTLVPDSILTSLLQQRNTAEVALAEKQTRLGKNNPEVTAEQAALGAIGLQISIRISGIMEALKLQNEAIQPAGTAGSEMSVSTGDEDQEIAHIDEMLQNSPDLINAPDDHGHTPLENAAIKGSIKVAAFLLDHGADVNAGKFSALNLAANAGNRAMVEFLLSRGANINAKAWTGKTPLHTAADEGYKAVAEALLENKADINAQDDDGATPLLKAARNGHREIVQMLLDSGANLNIPEKDGRTPLSFAAESGSTQTVKALLVAKADPNADTLDAPLLCAIDKQDLASAELLLQAGANPNVDGLMHCPPGSYGSREYPEYSAILRKATPLWLAIQNHQLPMVQLLLKYKANPDAQISEPPSVIFWALYNTEILQALLDGGANANITNNDGRTPLSVAAENGSPEAVKLLLGAKADPNGGTYDAPLLSAINSQDTASAELLLQAGANPNLKGYIDGHLRNLNRDEYNDTTPLLSAVSMNQLPMVQVLLKYKADPNSPQIESTPVIFTAVDHSNTNILQALLDAGANPNLWNRDHWTPLMSAFFNNGNHAATVAILLKHGADPNLGPASGLRSDLKPLHMAASTLDEESMRLLLDYGADPNVRTGDGQTPLRIVEDVESGNFRIPIPRGHVPPDQQKTIAASIADLLRQHGALEVLPDWDHITVSRPSAKYSEPVFYKGTNDWNQFTLMELFFKVYYPSGSHLSFPDFTHIAVVRPNITGETSKRILVNLLNSTNGVDWSQDLPLEFGDVVEVSQREHTLADSDAQTGKLITEMTWCLKEKAGTAKLIVDGGQSIQLPLANFEPVTCYLGDILTYPICRNVLLSDSDLSRVKVTRRDPKTGKSKSCILDRSSKFLDPSDLWLRDGDIIEVPETQ